MALRGLSVAAFTLSWTGLCVNGWGNGSLPQRCNLTNKDITDYSLDSDDAGWRDQRRADDEFWDAQTFRFAQSVVRRVIEPSDELQTSPLLERCGIRSIFDEMEAPFGILFRRLFGEQIMSYVQVDDYVSSIQDSCRKKSFRLDVAYQGSAFCGWQTQPGNRDMPSVQESLEQWLQPLASDNSESVNLRVSGRTDARVSAIGQVCRFRTWKESVTSEAILDHVNECPLAKAGSLRCLSVQRVSESFHPTFGAICRAYVYLLDGENLVHWDIDRLDASLRLLEGRKLDCLGLSYGRVKTSTTLCTIHVARASWVQSPSTGSVALCIQVVGDRFLRRMVRILVATAIREVQRDGWTSGALLDIINQCDRRATAGAAPPGGLIFVGALFGSGEDSSATFV